MIKRVETQEELKDLKVGDLLIVLNAGLVNNRYVDNIAIIIEAIPNEQIKLYNITKPGLGVYITKENFGLWGRLLPNVKKNKNS